ncbi:Down syndrome cell adhesion molecule-like protein 1 homolog isoform X2 [Agrilus planipennis]|uniref:Down syndrome cell adhesion molecule-like protein 1 homolog isoform X2 n=1 Tax=Agrilus planipennis TaxID=224129 RepID=A0A1W4WJE9_AGRPL|nr:Down syndrome cell adhesion molecule-like protein 1 homolog isoform X2 [Agrilus planipennis]
MHSLAIIAVTTTLIYSALSAVHSDSNASDNSLNESPTNNVTKGSISYFDSNVSTNVTALLGRTAYLNCRVKNFSNRTVSWLRHRDVHLLTVGHYTYTNDQRFKAIHSVHTGDWTLMIKYPQHTDSGVYECQVSTSPHMSAYFYLYVVEAISEILGGPELYVDVGSTINLTCVVRHSPEPPAYIIWNHEGTIITYSSKRGGVSVKTEREDVSRSVLLIRNAHSSDSGLYTCNPSNARPSNITVHVLNGEHLEAMQFSGKISTYPPLTLTALIVLSTVYFMYC